MKFLQYIVFFSIALIVYTGLLNTFPSKTEDLLFLLMGISAHVVTVLTFERFYISKDARTIDKLILISLSTIVFTGVGYYLSSISYMIGVTVIALIYTIITLKKAVSFNWGG